MRWKLPSISISINLILTHRSTERLSVHPNRHQDIQRLFQRLFNLKFRVDHPGLTTPFDKRMELLFLRKYLVPKQGIQPCMIGVFVDVIWLIWLVVQPPIKSMLCNWRVVMPNAYWKSHSSIKHNRNFCRVQKRTVTSQVPSGYLTVCYGKLPIYRSFMMIYLLKMVMFHSYVK